MKCLLVVSFVGRKTYCMKSTPSERHNTTIRQKIKQQHYIAEDNHLVTVTVNCHPFNSLMFVPSEITHSGGFN